MVELVQLWGEQRLFALGRSCFRLLNLQFVQLLADFLVVAPQRVNFVFVLLDGAQQVGVDRFAIQKLVNDVLDVRIPGGSANLLKGLLVGSVIAHLLLHFGFEEGGPELLSQVVLLHFQLVGVLLFVSCLFGNHLLALHARNASLKSRLFVLDRLVQSTHLLSALSVVFVDHKHEGLEAVLGLQALLSSLSLLFSFFLKDCEFRLVRLMLLVHFDLSGNQIGLDALDHVFVLTLLHHLEVRSLFDAFHLVLCGSDFCLHVVVDVFDKALLVLLLLKPPFEAVQFLFLSLDLPMNEVVLLAELAHGCGYFFDFFAAAFPRRNHVVGLKQRILRHEFLLLLFFSFPKEVTNLNLNLLVLVQNSHVRIHLLLRKISGREEPCLPSILSAASGGPRGSRFKVSS